MYKYYKFIIECCVITGRFSLPVPVEFLFFIGSQLVALSQSGKIGVWHAMTQHVLVQDLVPIMSFDTAGSFLLLGCHNGAISYIGEYNSMRLEIAPAQNNSKK